MLIKEIVLNNFRIYNGVNKIELLPEKNQNIIIVSGQNGFGKTTFLMSLVWCLYGKNMERVDELYKKEIKDKGGYNKYIANSLNHHASAENKNNFSVQVTFTEVDIPEITCSEVIIKRSYNAKTSVQDKIEILIDGHPNDLIHDLHRGNQSGEEIFIRDFILPLEIAKFFFFDAEKIVSLADVSSLEQRKALSQAYSEVLGIHKYEELRNQLQAVQDELRKKSAKSSDKRALIQTEGEIQMVLEEISSLESDIEEFDQLLTEKSFESEQIQVKLIREGNTMTTQELNDLKDEEKSLESSISDILLELRELYDYIPFAVAGGTLMEIAEQVENEAQNKLGEVKKENAEIKIKEVLADLERERSKSNLVFSDIEIRNFYEQTISQLVMKHFYTDVNQLSAGFEVIHDFSDTQRNQLNGLVNNLKLSFKEKFARIDSEYSKSRTELDSLRRRIRDAEKNAEDAFVSELRDKKASLDAGIEKLQAQIREKTELIGEKKADLKTHRQRKEELLKKVKISEANKGKDETIERAKRRLRDFLIRFKEEKKKSLEAGILDGLKILMHKKNFIKNVEVDISVSGEDVEITLQDGAGRKIDKGSLSMGERQMYASALLKALVDESDIDFPVFIDSPMQKFDQEHARNIISHFYPDVANQVVIFPLIHKELTAKEYKKIRKKVSKTFLIHNETQGSKFLPVETKEFIDKYDQLYASAD